MSNDTRIAVDVAKAVFEVAISNRPGHVTRRERLPRTPSGRHFASYLGLTPREYSSGLKRHLGRISKRGDGYLRTLLIHGARSVLVHARKQQPDRLREWANNLAKTHVHNKAAVAVANKLARIVWAVWSHGRPFALMTKTA
jgi:transposase